MGVTLERVQFKFASIIGELCNEPKILSQFAVWLDMRLAEFKLRGSITLDCSGEATPPGWMQGLEEAIAANRHNNRSKQPDFTSQPVCIEDDNDVIITNEASSHLPHPVSLHSSRSPPVAQERRKVWRKRGDNPVDVINQDQYHSPNKNSRLSNTAAGSSDVNNPSYTESLVSIIQVSDSLVEDTPGSGPPLPVSDHVNRTVDGSASGRVETNDFHQGDTSSLSVYFPQSSASSFSGSVSNPTCTADNTLGYNAYTSVNSILSPSGSTPQKRERTYWSHEERRAIITNLLPIVQRTRKPPTKSDVYEVFEREPVLRTRHWEKVKFQAWSMYQQMVKRERNNTQNSQDTPAEP